MKSTTTAKLAEAIAHAETFITQMQQMDDKKLSKHLRLFQQQMQMAYEQKNHAAYQLLYEYEQQTIVARLKKMDAPIC